MCVCVCVCVCVLGWGWGVFHLHRCTAAHEKSNQSRTQGDAARQQTGEPRCVAMRHLPTTPVNLPYTLFVLSDMPHTGVRLVTERMRAMSEVTEDEWEDGRSPGL
jgi:hypothetical protein